MNEKIKQKKVLIDSTLKRSRSFADGLTEMTDREVNELKTKVKREQGKLKRKRVIITIYQYCIVFLFLGLIYPAYTLYKQWEETNLNYSVISCKARTDGLTISYFRLGPGKIIADNQCQIKKVKNGQLIQNSTENIAQCLQQIKRLKKIGSCSDVNPT